MTKRFSRLLAWFLCAVLMTGNTAGAAMSCCPPEIKLEETKADNGAGKMPCHGKGETQAKTDTTKDTPMNCNDGEGCDNCKQCVKSTPTIEQQSRFFMPSVIPSHTTLNSIIPHRPESTSPPPRHS